MKRIFLIGYMGAGKTTVGHELAKQMGLTFIDLDLYIETRYHKTIRELFEEKGEAGFREIERKTLHEVADIEDVLISTGGGAPCFFDNIDFMVSTGTTVYLKVSADELAARLEPCKQSRPIIKDLSGDELKLFIEKNLEKREPFYSKASIILDAEKMLTRTDVDHIVSELARIL
jgi:Shikimate kinase